MGYGDFGIFNQGPARTPTLDALSDESVCLTQHYSSSCVCAPARASLLTGRYPHRTGAIDTLEGLGLDRLAIREITLADHLSNAGYATGMVGKWHLGALDPRYHPNARGFDEFLGFRGGWADYYNWRLDRNGSTETADGRYLTDVFATEAANFIARHAGNPFFLHVAFNAPHTPLQAPEELVEQYVKAGMDRGVALIYAMNERMDAGVGQILDALDSAGCADNTIVLFTSDNGPALGQTGYIKPQNSSVDSIGQESEQVLSMQRFNCNFNGGKGNVYEGGIRIPMIVRWPDSIPCGQSNDTLVHYVDWLPTILDAAGVDPIKGPKIDGASVLSLLQGKPALEQPRRFWQWNRYTPLIESNAAIRDGQWKLVRPQIAAAMHVASEHQQMDADLKYRPELHHHALLDQEPSRSIPDPPPAELYDLINDPQETTNLASAKPKRTAKLLAELESWFAEVDIERRSISD